MAHNSKHIAHGKADLFPHGRIVWGVAAALAYVALALYAFGPYTEAWTWREVIWPVSMVVSGLGVYVLGRRWIVSVPASMVSGALYGFGPLAFYTTRFHPLAALLVAGIPWTFCPAVYVQRWIRSGPGRAKAPTLGQWLYWPLLILPFLAIAMVMGLLAQRRLFPIPLYGSLQGIGDWIGWVAPGPAVEQGRMPAGLYHVAWAALAIGGVMVVKARRWSILAGTGMAVLLAFLPPVMGTNPVIWLLVAMVWAAVVAGQGIEGIALAGWADRKWLVAGLIVLIALCVATFAWAATSGQADPWSGRGPLIQTFMMYGAGCAAIALILAASQLKIRTPVLRQATIYGVTALDIVLSARLLAGLLL